LGVIVIRRDEYGRAGAADWMCEHSIITTCMVVCAWLAVVVAIASGLQGLL
jgi:hypothetical protein